MTKLMPAQQMLEDPSVALFHQQWQVYRKFIDNNYYFHREVYERLRQILIDEVPQPFRFLVD